MNAGLNVGAPLVTIRTLDGGAGTMLTRFIGPRIASAPFSSIVNNEHVRREILTESPPSHYPVRWQKHRHLSAWRAGQLVGFLDAAVGLDSESNDLPDYQPHGIIRFLALPDRREWVTPVAEALFDAAQSFWQETGVAYVKAFHISTGYPSFQAGAGILPSDWGDLVRVLTSVGFVFAARYYCFARPLVEPIEEVVPMADLSLVYRGDWTNRRYEIYYRRVEMVASARVVRLSIQGDDGLMPIARIVNLFVDPNWRLRDIGKWLLRRAINDATHQGDVQMIVHLAQQHHAALNLLIQQGFQELNYRGYTLEKTLTQ
jgi:GNAT superfamily N-acetyltransferase